MENGEWRMEFLHGELKQLLEILLEGHYLHTNQS